MKKSRKSLLLLVFFLSLITGCMRDSSAATWVAVTGVNRPANHTFPMESDNALGSPNAPVRIDEYADFQCLFCKRFVERTERTLIDQYVTSGKICLVFHSMGNFVSAHSLQSNTESEDAAEAAYAAGEQNMFWQYHDVLFANQKKENSGQFTTASLRSYAQALGLDMKAFVAAIDSGRFRRRVINDSADATSRNVTRAPTFFINGKMIVGTKSPQAFQALINAALGATKGGS